MTLAEQWQLSGNAPDLYECFAVGRHLRPIAERFLDQVPIDPGDRVLDVACGTGIVARLVAARAKPPRRVTGLDLNAGMLSTAQRLGVEEGLSIDWKLGNATDLPFAAAEFELVLCQQGLQFIPDKLRALQEMRRVLSPKGMIAVNAFGQPSLFHAALAEALSKYVDASAAKLSLAPFGLSDSATLHALFDRVGFQGISLNTVFCPRRVVPTQEWLLQYSSGLPFADSIAGIKPPERAQMLREIALKLKDHWSGDSFEVPCEVHFVFAHA